jgi:hypothetical protein
MNKKRIQVAHKKKPHLKACDFKLENKISLSSPDICTQNIHGFGFGSLWICWLSFGWVGPALPNPNPNL